MSVTSTQTYSVSDQLHVPIDFCELNNASYNLGYSSGVV